MEAASFFCGHKSPSTALGVTAKKDIADSGKQLQQSIIRSISRVSFHDGSALGAGSKFFGVIKMLVMWKEILFDVIKLEVNFIEFVVTFVAEPEKSVGKAFSGAPAFDYQSD